MVAMKGVIPETTPLFMAGIRLVPAGILVLLAAAMMGRSQPQGWRAWLWIAVFAFVDGALFQGFLAEGLVRTGAGLGSMMIDSQPIAVAILAWWIFGEQIGLLGWIGLGIGVLGISLLGLPNEWIVGALDGLKTAVITGHWSFSGAYQGLDIQNAGLQDLLLLLFQNGQWLMLLAALSMAVGTIVARVTSLHVDPVVATGWHMILGGVPLFLLSAQVEVDQWVHLDAYNWLSLSYSTIFGSAIAYGLFFYFAASGSLTSLSSLTFLTPVFALLFGNLLLGEVLMPFQWVGVCFTLLSIYLINQREVLMAKFNQTRTSGESETLTLPDVVSLVESGHDPRI